MGWMSVRTDEPELLDGNTVPMSDRLEALAQLPLVNRFLGGSRAVLRDLRGICAARSAQEHWTLLDVGCGSGDIPATVASWAEKRGYQFWVVALDRDWAAIQLTAERAAQVNGQLAVVRADGLRLPIADRAVDIVVASMLCHHFYGDDLKSLVGEMARVAREAVIINDLHRHRLAYCAFRIASPVFLRGQVVKHDGKVSIRRGFVPNELTQLAQHFPEFRWRLRRRFAFRLCLVGTRRNYERPMEQPW